MLYVSDCIELMAAFPGRPFRIGDVISYVRNGRELSDKQARAMREGVVRALQALAESGSVVINRPWTNQRGWCYYSWQMTHEAPQKAPQTQQVMTH